MSYPLPLTRTEAYLAYKAGVIQLSELKPSLSVPRIGIDDWLAYWTGLKNDYPKNPDGTPMILQEEEAYIAYLCGVIDTYPEECLRRVGAYLRYIISARWGRPDHPLSREELYLSLIKTQFIPSGDPSSDIVIDGTTKAPFVDVKLYGDTTQQTYSGKNLVYPNVNPNADHGLTSTYDKATGIIHITGTATATWSDITTFVPLVLAAGTYTGSVTLVAGSYSGRVAFRQQNDGTGYREYMIDTNGSTTFSSWVSGTRYRFWLTTVAGTTYDFKIKIQVEQGSITSFEPYVGGIPSPNPDYPQAINTVTGTQTVSINGTDYPISLGSIELCKLGDYQDYIWKDGDSWKLHKETHSVTLTGAEYWQYPNEGDSATFFQLKNSSWQSAFGDDTLAPTPGTNVSVDPGFFKSTKFVGISAMDANMKTHQGIGKKGEWFRISLLNTWNVSTVEQLQAWLGQNNTQVTYVLDTPTDTVITNQNLINQLEALVSGGAENGTTYIKVNATDPNLPGLLVVEAPKYE